MYSLIEVGCFFELAVLGGELDTDVLRMLDRLRSPVASPIKAACCCGRCEVYLLRVANC